MIGKILFFIIVSVAPFELNAQTADSIQSIIRIDSAVNAIDNKVKFHVSFCEVITRAIGGVECTKEAFTVSDYYDANSKTLLKVVYNAPKKEEFIFTYYLLHDTLVFVRVVRRNEKDKVNCYYFLGNKIVNKKKSFDSIRPDSLLKKWDIISANHKGNM